MIHYFKPGDIVQLSREAAQKSKFPNRRGTVVSVTRTPSQIRVLWHETKVPQLMHFSLVRRLVYTDTSKKIGDLDHVKVFADDQCRDPVSDQPRRSL